MLGFLRQFRLTPSSAIGLAVAVTLGLAGLMMLAGTMSQYRAGRAFDRAMEAYTAHDIEKVHAYLDEAIAARPSYVAPQEIKGKLFIDDGPVNPAQYDEARDLYKQLADSQENVRRADGSTGPSLPVLIGRAVAELEADRVKRAGGLPSELAVAEARRRLERAAEQFPNAGDLYVNLATVTLYEGNVPGCRRLLDKVIEVGNLSLDGLPYFYNLRGLAELRDGHLDAAVQEFEKVREFEPEWQTPRLNLAAAYAQSLIRGDLDAGVAGRYAATISQTVDNLRKEKSPLVAPICHSLAIHYIRTGVPQEALRYLQQAEAQAPLSLQARVNRATAAYLAGAGVRVKTAERTQFFSQARKELEEVLKSPRLISRDKFAAFCILGTIHALEDRHAEAVACLSEAEQFAAQTALPAIRKQLPRIQRNLASLYYLAGDDAKALEYFGKSKGFDDRGGDAQAILDQLRTPPAIERFEAKLEKAFTEFDARIQATVAARSTNAPLDVKKGVRLTLHNAVTGEARPLPFHLEGALLRTRLVNLPQGRFTCRLEVTDSLGNRAEAETPPFALDREPPRLRAQDPAPDATVAKLAAIKFEVFDAISQPDPATVSVTVRYPGATGIQKTLVTRGRCRYASPDGSIKTNDLVKEAVEAPLGDPNPPKGVYTIAVRANDTLGKETEATWTFTLR